MTTKQIEIYEKLVAVLEGESLYDCNMALAVAIAGNIAQCIGANEYRQIIISLVNQYAEWFYDHRDEFGEIDPSQIPEFHYNK